MPIRWRPCWLFFLLLAGTVALRSVALDRPLVGNFATKNAVYAMIARNWARDRAPWQLPAIDCLAGGDRGWHLVEFPVAAYLAGTGWKWLGGSLDVWGRATSVVWSVASVAMLYWLVRRWHGRTAAWGAATALALSPVSVILGQSFMLEASLAFFTLATIACCEVWLAERRWPWLACGVCCFALLLLTKIYMLVLALPLAMLWLRAQRAATGCRPSAAAYFGAGLAATLPAIAWYGMAFRLAAPGGAAAERIYFSIRQNADRHAGAFQALATADFYRQLLDDLAGPVLTPAGLALAFVALWRSEWRRHAAWLAAMALLVLALPAKFHTLLYYYLAVLPVLCVLVGLGWQAVYERLRPGRRAIAGTLLVALALSLRHAAGPAFRTPAEDLGLPEAGLAVQSLAEFDEPVATLHGSATDLLYYCDRPGWALATGDPRLEERLVECRRQGAKWLATVGLDDATRRRLLQAGLTARVAGAGYEVFSLAPAGKKLARRDPER